MKSLHRQLLQTQNSMSRVILAKARELDLSSGQPKVLEYLMEDEGCDQKTLAASCEIEPATMGSILLRMEKKGLIERRHHDGNRRSLFVYLTEEGKKTAEQMELRFHEIDKNAMQGLNESEQQELLRLLQKVYANNQEAFTHANKE